MTNRLFAVLFVLSAFPAVPALASEAEGDPEWSESALVPSYAGSDDYIAFPLPLIVGRVGGVGISPNGPAFRFRNDRKVL